MSINPSRNPRTLEKDTIPGEDFLKTEYGLLNQWLMHGEEATHRIFNFYVTLLTAVLGAIIVLNQLISGSLRSSFLIVAVVSALLIIIGVVFFDALVTQYFKNTFYHIGILAIQTYYKRYPNVASTLREHPRFAVEADAESPESFINRRVPFIKFILPVGIQQIFISLINSLLVGVLIVSLVWGINGSVFRPFATVIVGIFGVLIGFLIHNWFARWIMQSQLDYIREMNISWKSLSETSPISQKEASSAKELEDQSENSIENKP